ncbi:hypothetical protein ACOSQ2_027685 [Xanthoceras sorbifolium]
MAANNSLPPGWRVEVRVRKNGRKEKVMIQRVEPEGLPPGWIKEVKVTKLAHKVRRDPFYTDPVSGYIFRSMKDVVRYLETGELGRLAYKPKDKGSHDDQDSENDNDHSPTAAKKQKITGQSSNPGEIAKDEDVANGIENVPLCEPSSNQGGAGADLSGSNLPEAKDSGRVVDEGKDSDKSVCLSTPAVGTVLDKQTSESGDVEDETNKSKLGSKSKKKKVLDLPRRSSKRLAGVALDATPELETSTRARRAVVKQSGDGVPSTVEGSKSTEESQESNMSKHHSGDLANPNENEGKIETKYESSKKQGLAGDLPPQNQAKVETGCEPEAKPKPGLTLDLPFGDLFSDPCIAFAIKTLTGDNFETSNGIEVSMGSNSNPEGITAPEENARREKDGDQKQNLAIPGHAVNVVESSCKTDDKPGLPLDSPFADILTDPCIEFAIKTLTGSIPVSGCDLDSQQQLNSSQTQSTKNFCQTEFLSQQYSVPEKPVTRGQARTRNVSVQKKSGGAAAAGLRQPGENRFNECH